MDLGKYKGKIIALILKYKYVIIVLLIGLVLMLIPFGSESNDTVEETFTPQKEVSAEEKLSLILSQVHGAGEVRVLLTVSQGEEIIYQTDSEDTGETVRIETVVITGSDRTEYGLVRKTFSETYRGAIIVCQGADDPTVRLAIVDAVSKVTGLGADKISVMKMK